jgi:hypothetical protein
MKKSLLLLFFSIALVFTSCKKDDAVVTPPAEDVSVSSVAPTQGDEGTVVTITGTNFGADKSALKVEFGTTVATIDTIIGGTQIKTKVPAAAVEGALKIKVTKSNITASTDFKVLAKIVGTWITEGANVAFGLKLAPFKVKKIVATFNENKSYTVVQTDSANVTTTFTGTYTSTESTYSDTLSTSFTKGAKVYTIVANQATPSTVTATGIYAISSTNMSYEVIQTSPALTGVNAPTAQGGFGSTTIGGAKYNWYIQKYVKQ